MAFEIPHADLLRKRNVDTYLNEIGALLGKVATSNFLAESAQVIWNIPDNISKDALDTILNELKERGYRCEIKSQCSGGCDWGCTCKLGTKVLCISWW